MPASWLQWFCPCISWYCLDCTRCEREPVESVRNASSRLSVCFLFLAALEMCLFWNLFRNSQALDTNFLHFPPLIPEPWLIATLFSRFVLRFPFPAAPSLPLSLFFILVVHIALDFNVSIKSDASAMTATLSSYVLFTSFVCVCCNNRSIHANFVYERWYGTRLISLHFSNFNKRKTNDNWMEAMWVLSAINI